MPVASPLSCAARSGVDVGRDARALAAVGRPSRASVRMLEICSGQVSDESATRTRTGEGRRVRRGPDACGDQRGIRLPTSRIMPAKSTFRIPAMSHEQLTGFVRGIDSLPWGR